MSDTDNIDVWSSWHVIQGDLRSTIETRSSNGALLDLGITPEIVILKQPEDDTVACQLHFDTTKLTGYYLQGVAVTSEARNVEVYYDNGEYIGTAGRSVLKNTEDNECCLLCCCTYELDHEIIVSRLLLKLLSLRGKDEIRITKLSLMLMENYGRGEEQEQMTWCDHIHNLPPLVQSLVNGLHSGPSASNEMNKLIMMLREARVAKEQEERKEMERQNKEIEEKEVEDTIVPLPMVTTNGSTDDDPPTALEIKLKQFITDQMALLEQKIEIKLNNLVKRLDNLESLNNNK